MSSSPADYFDKARSVAASVLFAAGVTAIVGSLLDWVVVSETPPQVPANQVHRLPPFSGIELGDGYVVIAAAVLIIVSAFFLVIRRSSGFAWLAFLGSIVIGGIATADYRGIEQLHVDLEGIGADPSAGIGLTLVAVAGFVGVVASVAAIAASPRGRGT